VSVTATVSSSSGSRREGLLARLRARGFEVRTLHDQIAALPALPPAILPGASVTRHPAVGERISFFAANPPGWQPVPADPADPARLHMRENWIVRRRRGRGSADYYRLAGASLQPLTEDDALMAGYAQIAASDPAVIRIEPVEAAWLLPLPPLPRAYAQLLGRFARSSKPGWTIDPSGLDLARRLLARLGLHVNDA
jgi:hypothetical protein